jgi:hypothetical protein
MYKPLQQLGLWATVIVLNATFNNISAYLGGQIFFVEGNRSARRKPSTCRKLIAMYKCQSPESMNVLVGFMLLDFYVYVL